MNSVKINIGGKERTAKLGLGFLEKVCKEENSGIEEIIYDLQGSNSFFLVPKLLFHSLSYSEIREGKEVDFTKDDVLDWIDEVGFFEGAVKEFLDAFTKSIEVLLPKDEGKKKPQRTAAKK